MKTFIKWFGNKTRHKRDIISQFPSRFHTYIEPFIGSGAVFLELGPQKWIINDLNTDIMNLWTSIRTSVSPMASIIEAFSHAFLSLDKRGRLAFCRSVTDKLAHMTYGPTRAAYFLLMKYCVYFGSLIKNNRFYFRGLELNFMKHKYVPAFSKPSFLENLAHVSRYLNASKGRIMNQDFRHVLELARPGDLVFLDPPYREEHPYDFSYHFDDKKESLEYALLHECRKLDQRKVMWLMTQADTPIVRRLFRAYPMTELRVYRHARKAYATELVIRNYTLPLKNI